MDNMPVKIDEPSGDETPNRGLRRPVRSRTEEDTVLSDMKVDREMRLRRISADRTFRSRHLNAVADRKLYCQTAVMERTAGFVDKSHKKNRKSLVRELSSLRLEKTQSVDEYLGQVRERSDNIRKTSMVNRREARRSPPGENVKDTKPGHRGEDANMGMRVRHSTTLAPQPPRRTGAKQTNSSRSRSKSVGSKASPLVSPNVSPNLTPKASPRY